MRILVTGSRDWSHPDAIAYAMRQVMSEHMPSELTLVHGDCPTGADRQAHDLAIKFGWEHIEPHPADWATHGRRAGPIRNAEMVALGADLCLAFISDCSSPRCDISSSHPSHGATGCAALAEAAGIDVRRWSAPASPDLGTGDGEAGT